MELIGQHAKKIMEGCKERARDAGLKFQDDSLEYLVTNRDLLELSPKNMIPTLYDYWVQDVEVLKETGRYELYPSNPYETVVNTRPPISFYNDNNPDWLNVMIFYHVLGHIDFFQNNIFFQHTWDYDFNSRALSDKRMIAKLRSERGRWVDYVIEFSRAVDNLVGYFAELSDIKRERAGVPLGAVDFYFDLFLQQEKRATISEYVKEIERYNHLLRLDPGEGEQRFLDEVKHRWAEFESLYLKHRARKKQPRPLDAIEFLMEHSEFLGRDENRWMLSVMEVIRNTSLYFQPQIRTKIINEGWSSYWHEKLFLTDERINGHEVDFAVVNAKVTSMPRVGLNPYALGMRLFSFLERSGDLGRISLDYRSLRDAHRRRTYDTAAGAGLDFIFHVRRSYSDSMFISEFLDQDFVDHNRLFVAGRKLNRQRMTWQYYVKSRKARDYRNMVLDSLYHPPTMEVSVTAEGHLRLTHLFEEKPLVRDYIAGTMLGLEFLWGKPVELETSEPVRKRKKTTGDDTKKSERPAAVRWKRVRYSMKSRHLSREEI